jgi:hypothetical protein
MMAIGEIIRDGVVLSAIASSILIAGLYANPRLFLQDYPADIQARVHPKTASEKRQSLAIGIPFLALLLAVPTISTLVLNNRSGGNASLLHLCLNAFGVAFIFNLIDLLILDWWMFCTLTPGFIVIPGTEGLKAYRDYGYHFKAFIKGTLFSLAAGLVIGCIVALL